MAATTPARTKVWGPLGLIGLFAVVGGLLVPQLVPGESPAAPPAAVRDDSKSPGDLRYTPPSLPEAPSLGGMLARLTLGTALVLGLCVATLVYGKRWLGALPPRTMAGELKLVESLHLGNRCTLHLVQLSARQVLVGADATGIKTVVPLADVFENVLTETPAPAESAAV